MVAEMKRGQGMAGKFTIKAVLAAFAAAAAFLPLQPAVAAAQQDIAAGRALAKAHCSACHAVGPEGASPLPKAPHFRELGGHYPLDNLAEALAEGIVAGHPDMPSTPWEPKEIDQLIAYLKSIQSH